MMCGCNVSHHSRRLVLTGGPGAGKTAVLELVRQSFCSHVHVLPEAASILFSGGFPRPHSDEARRATQRAIFHVQRELEASTEGYGFALVVCDRGTVDGEAYWPGPGLMLPALGTSLEAELGRYDAVIHLRTPTDGYERTSNPLRTESAVEAAAIDERIHSVWLPHSRRFEVPATIDFLAKARHALAIIQTELPTCCGTRVPASRERSTVASH